MEDVKRKSWFSRNWPWVVPVGGCLTLIVLVILGGGAIFFGVTKFLKNSEPYEYALQQVQEHPDVIHHIGEPIEPTGMVSGNLTYTNGEGKVNIQIPIQGSKAEATLYVTGEKQQDEWVYEKLYVLIKDTQESINLLEKTLEGI